MKKKIMFDKAVAEFGLTCMDGACELSMDTR